MKNGICVIRAFGKCLKGFVSRQNQQIDASAVCFFLHLVHDGERSISAGANHEASAFPGYPFFYRDRCVTELVTEFFRQLLFAFPDPAAVDDDIPFICSAVDFEFTKLKFRKVHGRKHGKSNGMAQNPCVRKPTMCVRLVRISCA